MTEGALSYLTPEAQARVRIDQMLAAAGWAVQGYGAVNLSAARGVAVREFVLAPGHGRADYVLFVDRNAVGALEAKKEGETLTGVAWQTAKYVDGIQRTSRPRSKARSRSSISRPAPRRASRTPSIPSRRAGTCFYMHAAQVLFPGAAAKSEERMFGVLPDEGAAAPEE